MVKMTDALATKLPESFYAIVMIGLTLASFPGACFSSFIAANSFKTVMPKVNPFLSVGIGAIVSMILAITRIAGDLPSVFGIIGASFGPICGAMAADYLLAGNRWSGPRAGFNPAGWIAWALGFLVGIMPNLHGKLPGGSRRSGRARGRLHRWLRGLLRLRQDRTDLAGGSHAAARPTLPESSRLLADQRGDQAGGFGARHNDPVAREELVIGERVATFPDAAPVDLEDLIGLARRMRANQVGLFGEAV